MIGVFTVVGCDGLDSLLEVELPGQLVESDLDDPALAETLARGAQGDFECMLSAYTWSGGLWAGEFHASNITRTNNIVATRQDQVTLQAGAECTSVNPPPFWLPMNVARVQGESAAGRIAAFPDGAVPAQSKDFLIGLSLAYAGYATLIASETFCEVAWDGGPRQTRAQGFDRARQRFTEALEHLSRVTSGPQAAEARELANMSLVGRARASLNLGDNPAVVSDAGQVDAGFVRLADRGEGSERRRNRVFVQGETDAISVTEAYRDLTVGGVPDPRVRTVYRGLGVGVDGVTDVYRQLKYTSRSTPIPFSSWREAQLMIAEAQGGQVAVDIINQLRATVTDAPGVPSGNYNLPMFQSTDPTDIRNEVIEERRRELWLQGTRIGDLLRLGLPFLAGANPQGEPYQDNTCIPMVEPETLFNPNW